MSAAEQEAPAVDRKRRPRPSDYPCPAGRGGHYMVNERKAGTIAPETAGPIIWVCTHCGLRFQTGVGAVP